MNGNMARHLVLSLALMVAAGPNLGSAATPPAFTSKPTVSRAGDKVRIDFAVDRQTDVAVFIENTDGEIVRHLVAGVLGRNPPAPLEPNSLSQSIDWDGKADYGKPAAGGPFKVRVALGLGAKYDKLLSSRPMNLAGSLRLGVGPDGLLYVNQQWSGGVGSWNKGVLLVLNRDGTYRRTLWPFASTVGNEEARGFEVMDLDGRLIPEEHVASTGLSISPFPMGQGWGTMAVSADGESIYAANYAHGCQNAGIFRMDTAGGSAGGPVVLLDKSKLGGQDPSFGDGSVALSSDGRHLFLTGIRHGTLSTAKRSSAIYKVSVPERTGLEVFFGDPWEPGNDQTHLSVDVCGLISDGQGHLLVADTGNDRVLVLNEADGKYLGAFKVERPRHVGVSTAGGAVYVSCQGKGAMRLLKFNGWREAKPLGEIQVPTPGAIVGHSMVVDPRADPVVVWMSGGAFGNSGRLVRIEEEGGKFDATVLSAGDRAGGMQECYLGLVVDRLTKEVYVRNGGWGAVWERFDDQTGKGEKLPSLPLGGSGGTGGQVWPTPSGDLYALKWPVTIRRYDRSGKPVPWADRRVPPDPETRQAAEWRNRGDDKIPNHAFVPVSMTEMPHTLGVRWSDGHHFVLEVHPSQGYGRSWKAMYEYLPTSQRASDTPIIWKLSDNAVGPKFDAAGNIYLAEIVRPKGWLYPPEVKAHLERKGRKAEVYFNCYGSIVKFSPKGGMIEFPKMNMGREAFDGEPALDPTLKTIEADSPTGWSVWRSTAVGPAKIIGAEWMHPGVGHVGWYGCNCENITFDVDEFGRTFFPDFCLYRIQVIDTAGNAITHIGGYGNAENRGPDSPVIDPKTGQLRERRADDPKDLNSPFAEPDIAMAWPNSVGVTDKHLYIGDHFNRRLLRAKLVYAVEAVCEVK